MNIVDGRFSRKLGLVLAGGNALGAYHVGVYEALHRSGLRPSWLVGSSVGAITAAIIAGSGAGEAVGRLTRFWEIAASPDSPWWSAPGVFGRAAHLTSVIETRLLGRPGVFMPTVPRVFEAPPQDWDNPSLYDLAPLKRTLAELIDFDRVNKGGCRVVVLAVDLETGEDVVFDNRDTRLELDHLLASAALIPNFPPARLDGRWLGDGGLSANAPIEILLSRCHERPLSCIVVDLFSARGRVPRTVQEASERQSDLMFAIQTRKALEAQAEIQRLRHRIRRLEQERCGSAPGEDERSEGSGLIDVLHLSYRPSPQETLMKSFDYSRRIRDIRRRAGERDAEQALALWRRAERDDDDVMRITEFPGPADPAATAPPASRTTP